MTTPGDRDDWSMGPPPQEPWEQPGIGWDNRMEQGLHPASVGKRIGAYIIDIIIVTVINFAVAAVLGFGLFAAGGLGGNQQAEAGAGFVASLISLAIGLTYFILLEARNGQTLAKMMLSIRSVKAGGGAMDFDAAWRRCIWFFVGSIVGLIPVVGWLLSIPVGLGVIIWLLVTTVGDKPRHRGFHDRFAGTTVVEA